MAWYHMFISHLITCIYIVPYHRVYCAILPTISLYITYTYCAISSSISRHIICIMTEGCRLIYSVISCDINACIVWHKTAICCNINVDITLYIAVYIPRYKRLYHAMPTSVSRDIASTIISHKYRAISPCILRDITIYIALYYLHILRDIIVYMASYHLQIYRAMSLELFRWYRAISCDINGDITVYIPR